jgi:rubrerythrin
MNEWNVDGTEQLSEQGAALAAIAAIARNEEVVGYLYTTYAQHQETLREFWGRLAEEERAHAAWVRTLEATARRGKLRLTPYRFNPESYAQFTNYLQEKLTEALEGEINTVGALSVAADIEGTLIEQSFEQLFEGGGLEVTELMRRMAASCHRHRAAVSEELRNQQHRLI